MVRVAVVLLLVGLIGASCRSGSTKAQPGSTPVAVVEFHRIAQQAAAEGLITSLDLPDDFVLVPEEDSSGDDQPEFAFTGDCARFNEYVNLDESESWLNDVAEATSEDFENPDGDGFSSGAAVFQTEEAAQGELDLMVEFFTTCDDEFEAAFLDFFVALTPEGSDWSDVAIDLTEIPMPQHGDFTHGLRMDMTLVADGIPLQFISDSATVRLGRMVGTMEYRFSGEPDIPLRDSVLQTVAERLDAGNSKLPD